jgi:hypothetical protein
LYLAESSRPFRLVLWQKFRVFIAAIIARVAALTDSRNLQETSSRPKPNPNRPPRPELGISENIDFKGILVDETGIEPAASSLRTGQEASMRRRGAIQLA